MTNQTKSLGHEYLKVKVWVLNFYLMYTCLSYTSQDIPYPKTKNLSSYLGFIPD